MGEDGGHGEAAEANQNDGDHAGHAAAIEDVGDGFVQGIPGGHHRRGGKTGDGGVAAQGNVKALNEAA